MWKRALWRIAALALSSLLPWPSSLAAASDPTAALARAIGEAEKSLQENEAQMAESRYRSALLEGWLLLGALEVAGGDLEAARQAFERASTATTETRRALTWRALVDLQLDRPKQAIAVLTRIVSRHPADVGARRLLAQALVADGRYEEAVQELEEARAAAPEDAEIVYNLANGYLRLGRVDRAEPLFETVVAARPIPQTHVLIGRSYGNFRYFDHARAAFRQALAIDPQVRRGHYYLGTVELLAAGRDGLEAAIANFEQAIRLAPENPMTNLYLGTARLATRQFAAAIPALEVAARQDQTRIDALRFLGGCYLGLDRPAAAIETLQLALQAAAEGAATDRQLSSIHYQLGVALRRQGAGAEALAHFTAAEEHSERSVEGERESLTRFLSDSLEQEATPDAFKPPLDVAWLEELGADQRRELRRRVKTDVARIYLNLGVQHLQARRFTRAAELIAQAAAVEPGFPQVQYSLGVAYFNAESFDRATGPLSLALAEDPGNADLRRMTAIAWLNADGYARAAELLRDDSQRQVDPSLQYAYGLALVRSGRAAEAQAVFDRLMSRNADWPELHVALGQASAQRGDYTAAVASLERALTLKDDVAEAHSTLGELYLRQGKLDEAERELRAELRLRPQDVGSRYHLATVLDLNRRTDQAKAELETVLAVKPEFADARYLLGKILLGQSAAQEAAAHLEAAAQLSPTDANIAYQLGQAYQRLGRGEQAQRQFEIYRRLKRQERGSE